MTLIYIQAKINKKYIKQLKIGGIYTVKLNVNNVLRRKN